MGISQYMMASAKIIIYLEMRKRQCPSVPHVPMCPDFPYCLNLIKILPELPFQSNGVQGCPKRVSDLLKLSHCIEMSTVSGFCYHSKNMFVTVGSKSIQPTDIFPLNLIVNKQCKNKLCGNKMHQILNQGLELKLSLV